MAPSPPQPALPSPTSPDGRLPCRHPGLAPRGPPRPARLGEGAGALAWAGFPLPRLCLCPLPCVFTFLPPSPLLSPLPSSIFSFPLPPLPARPLLFHLSFLLAPPGSPLFGISWGPPQEAGEGALWTALSPRPSHAAQRRSISPLSIRSSGLEGAQPSVPPGSVSVCRVRVGPGPGRLGSLPAAGGGPHPLDPPDRQTPSPTKGLPCTLHLPTSFPLASPHPFFSLPSSAVPLSPPAAGLLRG